VKRCETCQRVKPLDNFYYRSASNNYFNSCIPCRAKNIAQQKSDIYNWVNKYKSKIGCEACGEKDSRCLQLHHRDSSNKKKSVATLIGGGYIFKTVKAEVAKCEVLCANCHSIHHHEERRSKDWGAGKYVDNIISDECIPVVEQLELFLNYIDPPEI
tara:strand:+ start:5346 stop:5816 length:471 start_codon:yes stop_codon:yes gene_type:complete